MRIILTRSFENLKATMGMIKIEGQTHDPIFTLENPKRHTSFDSCIPTGLYKCEPHSGPLFQNVWELKTVPGRSAILIHPGNTERDTLGCILIGLGAGAMKDEPCVTNSRLAIEYFRKLVEDRSFEILVR